MTAMQGALSAAERSMRSVFVGNIPYEATEEQLKDIFSEVGPVVSFRLVYDRETGKPKGYGFCEYKDQEMALSAMRNLNGYELNGRALRVDNAASEKSKEELKNLQASLGGPPVESPYGPEVSPEDAPEAIAKVMSSLPPEQLYELMLQMKQCLENNPNETRDLLLQNPQLSYALLQAQVIMKIVDPEKAKTMLHSENPFVMTASALLPTPDVNNSQAQMIPPGINDGPPGFAPGGIPLVSSSPVTQNTTTSSQRPSNQIPGRPSLLGDRPITNNSGPPNQFSDHGLNSRSHGDEDLRQMPVPDRDMRAPPPGLMGGDQDMRHLPVDKDFRSMTGPPRSLDSRFPNIPPAMQNMPHGDIGNLPSGDMRNMPPGDMRGLQNLPSSDMRNLPLGDMHSRGPNDMHSQSRGMPPMNSLNAPPGGRSMAPGDTRNIPLGSGRNMPPIDNRGMPLGDASNRGPMFDRQLPGGNFDGPVPSRVDDHRGTGAMNSSVRPLQNPRITAVGSNSPAMGGASPNPAPSPRSNAAFATAAAIAPHDQEKATLIMQVLQLSDQQIAILPPEQRQSILILKEQIARSTQAS